MASPITRTGRLGSARGSCRVSSMTVAASPTSARTTCGISRDMAPPCPESPRPTPRSGAQHTDGGRRLPHRMGPARTRCGSADDRGRLPAGARCELANTRRTASLRRPGVSLRTPGARGPCSTMGDMADKRGRVLLAGPRGYCAGVDRAAVAVERALEIHGAPVYVRKQIVHNKHVVATLERRGAVFVEETDEVPEGAVVVFSAHGVSPAVHAEAATRQLRTIDATCPLVTKVHSEAKRFAKDDYDILLIGHRGHEEVEGTSGEVPEHIQLVDGPEDIATVQVRDPDKVVWLSQTTLSVDETLATVDELKNRFPGLQSPPSDDICYATQNRQQAVKQMAGECDLVLVVGSTNSSNSVRLVEVALEAGARDAHLDDSASVF